MNIPPEMLQKIFQGVPSQIPYTPGGVQQPTGYSPMVNRSGPATPPPIPVPNNQGPYRGFMGQAFNLAGVPRAPMMGQGSPGFSQLPPQLLAYLQALQGGGGIGINRIPYANLLQALRGVA